MGRKIAGLDPENGTTGLVEHCPEVDMLNTAFSMRFCHCLNSLGSNPGLQGHHHIPDILIDSFRMAVAMMATFFRSVGIS